MPHLTPVPFQVASLHALYTDVERGLNADLVAARALGGVVYPLQTFIVAAGHGHVVDVTEVPTDSVLAQWEHLTRTTSLEGLRVATPGNIATMEALFPRLREATNGPLLFDLQLTGTSGEVFLHARSLEALRAHLSLADVLLLNRRDAELLTKTEIRSLDDAQVVAQRLHRLGARQIVLKCGNLPLRFTDPAPPTPGWAADLYYDGEEFALFEAPYIQAAVHGKSSAFGLMFLRELLRKQLPVEALQKAKMYVTEAIRHAMTIGERTYLNYHWYHVQAPE